MVKERPPEVKKEVKVSLNVVGIMPLNRNVII